MYNEKLENKLEKKSHQRSLGRAAHIVILDVTINLTHHQKEIKSYLRRWYLEIRFWF